MIGTHTNPATRNTLRDMFIEELLKKDEEFNLIIFLISTPLFPSLVYLAD